MGEGAVDDSDITALTPIVARYARSKGRAPSTPVSGESGRSVATDHFEPTGARLAHTEQVPGRLTSSIELFIERLAAMSPEQKLDRVAALTHCRSLRSLEGASPFNPCLKPDGVAGTPVQGSPS
jgi:hypothetical protein